MAHSTSTGLATMELPRYRRGKTDDQDEDADRRFDSFDSTYSSRYVHEIPEDPESPHLQHSSTLATTNSLLDRPVVRKLVFRRHWFHTDMTVCIAHPATSSPATQTPSATTPAPEIATSKSTFKPSNTANSTFTQTETPAETETPAYHLATCEFSFNKPDIIMYSGSKSDPAHILAVSHFRWSRNARMGFGADAVTPDKNPNGVIWEELRNTSSYLLHHTYEFSVPTESSSRSSSRRHFRLQRTHAAGDGVEGWLGWMSYRNYRLIDLDAHETVGVFLADNLRSLTKKGELRLFKPLAKEVEVGVVLALGSVSEKHTRRERHSRNHGHGG